MISHRRYIQDARNLLHVLGGHGGRARQLAYLLYQKANDRGWAVEAGAYNSLITAWPNLRTGATNVAAAASGPGATGVFVPRLKEPSTASETELQQQSASGQHLSREQCLRLAGW